MHAEPHTDSAELLTKSHQTGRDRLAGLRHPGPLIFAALGIIITAASSVLLFQANRSTVDEQFLRWSERVESGIQIRFNGYEQALQSCVALWQASEQVTAEEWKTYVEALDFHSTYPGIEAIGYAALVEKTELADFEEAISRDGFAGYSNWPRDDRPLYAPVLYPEPNDHQARHAFGSDFMTDITRRKALELAVATGVPALSGAVEMTHDESHAASPGFLLLLPLYDPGAELATPAQRKNAAAGLVCSAFRVEGLLEGLPIANESRFGLRITDISRPEDERIVYTSEHYEPVADHRDRRVIDFAGGRWAIYLSGHRATSLGWVDLTSFLVGIAGLALTLLGVIVLADSKSTQDRATKIALGMTESLRRREREILELNENLEQEVESRTARLREANQELQAFSYSVSHDLRAPLRHIRALNGFARKECGDSIPASARSDMEKVDEAAQRMESMIDGILNLAKAGHSYVRLVETNLTKMAREIVTQLGSAYPERNIEVEIDSDLVALVDPDMARTILQNLLENAFKFTAEKDVAEIRFGAHATSIGTEYFISDNGKGFDGKKAERAFALFKRLDKKSESDGTGVGLALVKKAVQRHGGAIWAESRKDGGAIFRFTLAPAGSCATDEHTANLHHIPGFGGGPPAGATPPPSSFATPGVER